MQSDRVAGVGVDVELGVVEMDDLEVLVVEVDDFEVGEVVEVDGLEAGAWLWPA